MHMTSTGPHIEQRKSGGLSTMAVRGLVIIGSIAVASVLLTQAPTKTASSVQPPSLRRTTAAANETDVGADINVGVFGSAASNREHRGLPTTSSSSSSDNIFVHQRSSSGYGYVTTPNNYWKTGEGYLGYSVYNQKHKYPTGYNYPSYEYQSYPSYTSYSTGHYPAPRPSPSGRIKKWDGGRKKRKKQSCYVKCCRKIRGRRPNMKKKCRRRCKKKNNNRPKPKNPCNMNPCPQYPCGTNPCPKYPCPGETVTTCARICSSAGGCAFFGFSLGSSQCLSWTSFCEPLCQLGREPPSPLPPTSSPTRVPTPRPPTLPITSRTCQCNTPLRGRSLQDAIAVVLDDDDPGINIIGKLLPSEEEEDFQIEPECNALFFYPPPDQDDSPPLPPPPPPPPPPAVLVATPVQKYLIPLRENLLFQTFGAINSAARPPVRTLVSIAVPADDTVVWLDHWEDKYDQNLQNPSTTTEIWGDGDKTNGCIKCRNTLLNSGRQCQPLKAAACILDSSISDILEAGTSIIIENEVTLLGNSNRDPSKIFYDGGDSLQASFPISVSRAAFPYKDGAPNSLEAGAVEVADTEKWGKCFVSPVGRDLRRIDTGNGITGTLDPTYAFEETDMFIMAGQPGTIVTVPKPIGNQEIEVTRSFADGSSSTDKLTARRSGNLQFPVDVGQTIRIRNLNTGDEICSNNPVQANLVTGDRNSDFEMRWYSLLPKDQFASDYFTPVTRRGSDNSNGAASVYLYNPGPSDITVVETLANGQPRNHVVAGGKSVLVGLNENQDKDSGHRFKSNDGSPFFGLVLVDTEKNIRGSGGNKYYDDRKGLVVDWGVPLQPTESLTAKAIIGLGYACTLGPRLTQNQNVCFDVFKHPSSSIQSSPVWVAALEAAQYLVDYNCDGSVDKRIPRSGTNPELKSVIITDAQDQDMSGACITAEDAIGKPVKFAAVWGQDSTQRGSTRSEMDMGILQFSLPELKVYKNCDLIVDATCDDIISPGDTISCSIRVTNTGGAVIEELTVTDPLPPGLTYGSGTFSSVDGTQSNLGVSYPLGNGKTYSGVGLASGKSLQISYTATIDSFDQWTASGLQSLIGTTSIIGEGTEGTSSVTQTAASQFSTSVTICDGLSSAPSRMPTTKAPTHDPTANPTKGPTASPSRDPSAFPSHAPSLLPSNGPSRQPSASPSTPGPTDSPTRTPSSIPSVIPSSVPSASPSLEPSHSPSLLPSSAPSSTPSRNPSESPSVVPSSSPSALPSSGPSSQPSRNPSESPSNVPSKVPSSSPSVLPSSGPSSEPSRDPSESPSKMPSGSPSLAPSTSPSSNPSKSPEPSALPSVFPSSIPSSEPSPPPSFVPSNPPSVSSMPSSEPSSMPSSEPSQKPSSTPSLAPSSNPSSSPSDVPSLTPSSSPSNVPSRTPSVAPSSVPSSSPSSQPSSLPSSEPSALPSGSPSDEPSRLPSSSPSSEPSSSPSSAPSLQPSSMPSRLPSSEPSSSPSSEPSSTPSVRPSVTPSAVPSSLPSAAPSAHPSLAPSPIPSSLPSITPSVSPSEGPSSRPSLRPSESPSMAPSSTPTDFPTLSPTTPEPTFPPTTAEPTPGPDPNTFCFMTYEVRTDPEQQTLVYAYEFLTELTECLFFRVYIGYFDEIELTEACSGYVTGQGAGSLTRIDASSCRFTARFPPNSLLNVRIEYTALFTLPGAPPDQDRCSNSAPLSTCECEEGACEELGALVDFPFEKFFTEGICACNDCLL